MRYLILADLKSLWRQFAWVFYLCALGMVLSVGFLAFTYVTGMNLADESDAEQHQEQAQSQKRSLSLALSGDCPTQWPSDWRVLEKEELTRVDDAVRSGDAAAGINCRNGNAELVVELLAAAFYDSILGMSR